jgi:hypothetical protein
MGETVSNIWQRVTRMIVRQGCSSARPYPGWVSWIRYITAEGSNHRIAGYEKSRLCHTLPMLSRPSEV